MAKGTLTRDTLPMQFAPAASGENSKARRARLRAENLPQVLGVKLTNGGHSDVEWEEIVAWCETLPNKRRAEVLRMSFEDARAEYARAMAEKDHQRDVKRQNANAAKDHMRKFRKVKSKKAKGKVCEHAHDSTLQGYPYMASPTGGAMVYVNYNNHMGYKLT